MSAPMLFNCTDDEDVYVRVDGELVRLPLAPRPVLLFTPEGSAPQAIRVPSITDPDVTHETAVNLYRSHDIIGAMDLPAKMDDVLYLVNVDTLREFPYREDFVAPAVWSYVLTDGSDEYADDNDELPGRRRVAVLVGITRATDPAADQTTPVLEWPGEDEWDDPERD